MTAKIGTLFEGGAQIRKLLMETAIEQGGMDRAALVFGMMELIVDLKPEGESMLEWAKHTAEVFGHFARQKSRTETLQ